MTSETRIKAGQIYESCQPTFVVDGEPVHTRIRIVGAPDWTRTGKTTVATLTEDGRALRPRSLETSQLHASGTTRTGAPRRTGYRLVQEAS